ncbi:gamma-aminobutyric acid receptor subunit rho-1-like [Rhopilema esculentum]|uniref:gamma-aminobutyric acid receptor subunit rho-1-like n=1 Tax=Rhopilema esculentum TaxID=499914 RepID=UPI0031D5D2A1|eukprot:gene14338-5380_t
MGKYTNAAILNIFLLLFKSHVATTEESEPRDDEIEMQYVKRLLESDQYDFRIRPNFPYDLTNITVGFSVLTIEDLQIEDMAFTLEIFLMQEWEDPRLRHDYKKDLDASHFIKDIWIPDTFFQEATITDRGNYKQYQEKKSLLRIHPNGSIYHSSRESLRLSCGMDLKMFPADVQTCNITIGSYAFENREIRYHWKNSSRHVYTFKNKSLSHYEIDPMSRTEVVLNENHGEWSKLRAQITFRRKTSAFISAMYFPCTVIVIASWITFFIHPDHFPARTNLCAVSVLTIITLQGGLNNTLPKVSYIKSIDMYVWGCVLFVSGAFVEYVLVLLLKHKKRRVIKRKERKKLERIKLTGDVDLFKDDGKTAGIITKGNNNAWTQFYLKEEWPIVLDEYSRMFFPFAFVAFTAIYWLTSMKGPSTLSHSNAS